MSWIKEACRRIASILSRDALENGLDEEVRFHIDHQIEKNLRAGMRPAEARREALLKFGAMELMKERTRDEFRAAILEDSVRDLRFGTRALRRSPVFTLVASLTLAIGIGAVTAVFSVVNGVLLKPLPYPHADALIDLAHVAPGVNLPGTIELSAAQFFTYREENRTFEHIGLWSRGTAILASDQGSEEVECLRVTHGTLQSLGVPPTLGRWFSEQDDTPGTPETVILSYGHWQRRHGGDRSIVGRTLTVDTQARQIIGVMPEGFRSLGGDPEVILPFRLDRSRARLGQFNFLGLARLKPDITLTQANADVARMIPIWLKGWPSPPGVNPQLFESARFGPALRPLKQAVVGDVGDVLWLVMGTIAIVLLISVHQCREPVTRDAPKDASRNSRSGRRSAPAGAASRANCCSKASRSDWLEEPLALRWPREASVCSLPLVPQRSHDWMTSPSISTVLVFTLIASLLSSLLFGLVPVLRQAGGHVAQTLRGSARTSSDSRERHRVRNTLVIVQVALAMILLVGSGLMIRTFAALRDVRTWIHGPDRVQMMRVTIPRAEAEADERAFRMHNDIHDRIATVPGVSRCRSRTRRRWSRTAHTTCSWPNDVTYPEGKIPPVRRFKFVAPGFFATVGAPLVAGRDLIWTDATIAGRWP